MENSTLSAVQTPVYHISFISAPIRSRYSTCVVLNLLNRTHLPSVYVRYQSPRNNSTVLLPILAILRHASLLVSQNPMIEKDNHVEYVAEWKYMAMTCQWKIIVSAYHLN